LDLQNGPLLLMMEDRLCFHHLGIGNFPVDRTIGLFTEKLSGLINGAMTRLKPDGRRN
jgi:hypothetical protein